MRIVFVLTYPTHYAMPDLAEWLRWDNRDRRMPALLKAMGVDVELWGVGTAALDTEIAPPDLPPIRVRLFPPRDGSVKPREQTSAALCAAAAGDAADLFVLIGTDGRAGLDLHRNVLKRHRRRHAVIIGGTCWSRAVADAACVFTESAAQERLLGRPGWRFWRRPVGPLRMFRLPKTIDTARFHPLPVRKRWDIVAASRLIAYKSFDEIGALSGSHPVAVAGDGPRRAELESRWPHIEWLGHVPHAALPETLSAARLFFHAGRRDWFPRAIPEAMACGLPVVAFGDRIGPDVVPPATGLLVDDRDFRSDVADLLADEARLEAMGLAARDHVVANHGPRSSEAACRKLIELAR